MTLLALTGCAQLLGLEETNFEQRDAMIDAMTVCDGAPRCTAGAGRSVCGQLFETGTNAGRPLRVATPTGMTCGTVGSTEGPCALNIYGQAMSSYFVASTADRIAGEIDDCGRYVVPDLDQAVDDIAVVATGTDFEESATVLLDRALVTGTDRNVDLPIVSIATGAMWGMQLDPGNPPNVLGAYLVTYVNPTEIPIAMQELRVNGGIVGDAPVQPWGAYFSGTAPYGTIDPSLSATQTSGTALVVPGASSFMLGGFRPGKNCTPVTLQRVSTALIHVTLSC